MPLIPKELTAARRGRPSAARHGSLPVTTRNGERAKSKCSLGRSKCREGTSSPCRIPSRTLVRLATPAAAEVCPMLVLTEPIAQNPVSAVPSLKTVASASSSIGSPSLVPVPCAST